MDDLQAVFARAEQAFVAGRLDAALTDLAQVQRRTGGHAAAFHLLGLIERKRGNPAAARSAYQSALALTPANGEINNNYANLLKDSGEFETALLYYDRALASAPALHTARYNRALLLQRLGRQEEALTELDIVAAARPDDGKIHAARGTALRALSRLGEAAAAYDRALSIDPARTVALNGRALVATQRGEARTSELYRDALAAAPRDREMCLGLASALSEENSPEGLEILATQLVLEPSWWAGHAALARARWEAGESTTFTSELQRALEMLPNARDGWLTYANALASTDQSAAAADAAAAGRQATGGDVTLGLLEALQASEAGQLTRAERLYEELPADLPGRSIHEMRHRLRIGDYRSAAALADQARVEAPWDVGVWAMTGIVWRLRDDPRASWLLEQAEFIATQDLDIKAESLANLASRLRGLHRSRAHPIGQSLRGGTQTHGRLFEREDREIVALRMQVVGAVQRYWEALPALDHGHPLLRNRTAVPRLAGSWSVRLTDGGFHIAHMHPHGVLSSACYIVVPEARSEYQGWLEIGGAPDGLDLPITPLLRIAPKPGRIVLFPSYCYHGTRPFAEGERLSVAFDVNVD